MNRFQRHGETFEFTFVQPTEVFEEVYDFIDGVCASAPVNDRAMLLAYLDERRMHGAAVRQDLLPLLVYHAVGGQDYRRALPLAATWTLALAASHLMNRIQDEQGDGRLALEEMNRVTMILGAANVALSHLEADADSLRDLLDALGQATVLASNAQNQEVRQGRVWTRRGYLEYIARKSAAIIATGAWMGGRLATEDEETLQLLKEFGLALGMTMQISDDCLDLVPDLVAGTYTLPVIVGRARQDHPDYPLLKHLTDRPCLSRSNAEEVAELLAKMEAIDAAFRVARAYQAQAATIFDLLPVMEQYFGSVLQTAN